MEKQAKGKIFLSDQRGLVESPQLRRYSTFNFGDFVHEHKGPFGSLYMLNEEHIAGGRVIELKVEEPSYIITIPVTGDVKMLDTPGNISAVDVGEVQIYTLPAHTSLHLANPYENHVITLLQIALQAQISVDVPASRLFTFSFTSIENQLAPIVSADQKNSAAQPYPFAIHIGRFAGRREAIYRLKNTESTFFCFVMSGAFEIAGRLLQEKDSLALWNIQEVELEALSNHALLLVIEILDTKHSQT